MQPPAASDDSVQLTCIACTLSSTPQIWLQRLQTLPGLRPCDHSQPHAPGSVEQHAYSLSERSMRGSSAAVVGAALPLPPPPPPPPPVQALLVRCLQASSVMQLQVAALFNNAPAVSGAAWQHERGQAATGATGTSGGWTTRS